MFFVIIILIASFSMMVVLYKKQKALAKYEFENRTSGGMVEFGSFEESVKHQRNKNLTRIAFSACLLVMLMCLLIIL